jgi:hypothetical protein
MTHITVDAAQAALILNSGQSIEIRDEQGRHLGFVAHGFSDADLATAAERANSDEPRYTTEEVRAHLKSLADE